MGSHRDNTTCECAANPHPLFSFRIPSTFQTKTARLSLQMFGSIPRDYIEISGLLFSPSEMKALSGRFPASRCFFFQNTMSVPRSGMQIQSNFLQNIAKDSHAHQRALSSFRIQSGIGAFRDILRFRHANFPLRIFLYSYIHEFVKRISVRQLPLSLPFSSRIRYVKTFQERRFSFKRLFVSPAMKAFSKRFRSR